MFTRLQSVSCAITLSLITFGAAPALASTTDQSPSAASTEHEQPGSSTAGEFEAAGSESVDEDSQTADSDKQGACSDADLGTSDANLAAVVETPDQSKAEADRAGLGQTEGAATVVPFTAQQAVSANADGFEAITPTAAISGTWGTAPWTLENGMLRIGAGVGTPALQFGSQDFRSPWHEYADDITKIYFTDAANTVLPEDSSYLFRDLHQTTLIMGLGPLVPNRASGATAGIDTSHVTGMSYMFSGMSSLRNVDVSTFDTSNVRDMKFMFNGTTSLPAIDVSNFDTSKVTNMNSMFKDASALTTLDVTSFDTTKVTNMGSMFWGVTGLTQLDVSNFNTSNVTNMSNMFNTATGLTSLDVTNFDTAKVTNFNSMFSTVTGLKELDVTKFDTSSATTMNGMFYNASGIESLDVTGFRTPNVTNMQAMFFGMSALTELDVTSFDTSKVEKMGAMFFKTVGIKKLDLSSFNTESLVDFHGIFERTDLIQELVLSPTSVWDGVTGLLDWTHDNYTGKWIAVPGVDGLTSWGGTSDELTALSRAETITYVRQVNVPVTFHANNTTTQTSADNVPEAELYTLPENTFTYEGHTFVEWNTAPDGSGISHADMVPSRDGVYDYYAIWKAVDADIEVPVEKPTDKPTSNPTDKPAEVPGGNNTPGNGVTPDGEAGVSGNTINGGVSVPNGNVENNPSSGTLADVVVADSPTSNGGNLAVTGAQGTLLAGMLAAAAAAVAAGVTLVRKVRKTKGN